MESTRNPALQLTFLARFALVALTVLVSLAGMAGCGSGHYGGDTGRGYTYTRVVDATDFNNIGSADSLSNTGSVVFGTERGPKMSRPDGSGFIDLVTYPSLPGPFPPDGNPCRANNNDTVFLAGWDLFGDGRYYLDRIKNGQKTRLITTDDSRYVCLLDVNDRDEALCCLTIDSRPFAEKQQLVLVQGDTIVPLLDNETAGVYNFGSARINDDGLVVFAASLTSSGNVGLYLLNNGKLTRLFLEQERGYSVQDFCLGESGEVVFSGNGPLGEEGIYAIPSPAVSSDIVPRLTTKTHGFTQFVGASTNRHGEIAFWGRTTKGAHGIYVWSPPGKVRTVVETTTPLFGNRPVEIAFPVGREIINDNDQVAFKCVTTKGGLVAVATPR